jgi:hypothetical protein
MRYESSEDALRQPASKEKAFIALYLSEEILGFRRW